MAIIQAHIKEHKEEHKVLLCVMLTESLGDLQCLEDLPASI